MKARKYSIKHWPKDDKPSEKLLRKKPMNLSDAELLAILITNGTTDKSALDLARELLQSTGNNLNKLAHEPISHFTRIRGIGQAKAVKLAAALELGRRCSSGSLEDLPKIFCSADIAGFLKPRLGGLDHEIFGVIYLNRANKITNMDIISEGGISGTVADPRIILKKALDEYASSLILFHNHPSGNLIPSGADKQLTQKIKEAANYLDIMVLDHVILSDKGHYSFADEGLLD